MSDGVDVWRLGRTIVAHGASWAFKPGGSKSEPQYIEAYRKNPILAERDYGANPPKSVQAALLDPTAITRLVNTTRISPVDNEGGFHDWFVGDERYEYFLHIDMSKSTDPTGMGMCHYDLETDKTVVDLIHTIDPTEQWELSFARIEQLIYTLNELGFKFASVSFDTWQSYQMVERLVNAGIPAHHYSVDRGTEAYDTLFEALLMSRLDYFFQARFDEEVRNLKLYGGKKYDHPPGGTKDTADGVAGCVAQCVKARVGLAVLGPDVDKIIHDQHILKVVEDQTPDGHQFFKLDRTEIHHHERTRARVMRVDAADDLLIMVLGWHDKANDRLFVDEFLVWPDYSNQDTLHNLERFVVELMGVVRIDAFSLNELVPLEVLDFLQKTGRPVSSPLSARTVGRRGGRVARTAQLDPSAVRMCIAQLKKGNLYIPKHPALIKDLKYTTPENQMQRIFLAALAGWTDFLSREAGFGRVGQTLPRMIQGSPAPISPAQRGSPSMSARAVRTGSADIDRLRDRYSSSYPAPRAPGSGKPTQPGMRSLPRPRRG